MTLARKVELPENDLRIETCRSNFSVLMWNFYICASVGVLIKQTIWYLTTRGKCNLPSIKGNKTGHELSSYHHHHHHARPPHVRCVNGKTSNKSGHHHPAVCDQLTSCLAFRPIQHHKRSNIKLLLTYTTGFSRQRRPASGDTTTLLFNLK